MLERDGVDPPQFRGRLDIRVDHPGELRGCQYHLGDQANRGDGALVWTSVTGRLRLFRIEIRKARIVTTSFRTLVWPGSPRFPVWDGLPRNRCVCSKVSTTAWLASGQPLALRYIFDPPRLIIEIIADKINTWMAFWRHYFLEKHDFLARSHLAARLPRRSAPGAAGRRGRRAAARGIVRRRRAPGRHRRRRTARRPRRRRAGRSASRRGPRSGSSL